MDHNSKDIQLQYEGFLNTPFLWRKEPLFGLKQFEFQEKNCSTFEGNVTKQPRLGKRVERFISFELQQQDSIKLLFENFQIQNGKITIGEIDFLLQQNKKPIHLEAIYKFYLYDENFGSTEIEHWIGPNRKDNLVKKLTKLKNKQLPLLYKKEAKILLDKYNLNVSTIKQRVYFKAQLFVPLRLKNKEFKLINNTCITGFYIDLSELQQFKKCKFYIPTKINWLQNIKVNITWLNFNVFSTKIKPLLNQQTAPLCWIKHPNGETEKCFIVWWN
ncbi:hypothetical protein SAMN05444411_103216 [Lutibacter oricola]|uniref:DUF1853 domain-containing protein n=1 Tax=Lutibacter oricola TaxID=762486 RepID=A0A1H2ZF14_9FLAO|nr:DUF1853 family protein [Lutibacter oricola]SDX15394.1 hypothetical protein SAMN05444411_103216 [Lutibacter oricola]